MLIRKNETAMKKLLLTGIAALLLATGAAHAQKVPMGANDNLNCDGTILHYKMGVVERFRATGHTFEVQTTMRKEPRKIVIRLDNETGAVTVNGRRCCGEYDIECERKRLKEKK
jgi:opacity protein-like surface antigen